MLWDWIVDHIPVWGWMVIFGVPTMVLLYFFYPVLIPLWNIMPKWLKVTLAFIVSVTLAALAGRYRGRQNAEEEQRRRDAEALQKRTEVDNEIGHLNTGEVDKKLRDRWSRNDDP